MQDAIDILITAQLSGARIYSGLMSSGELQIPKHLVLKMMAFHIIKWTAKQHGQTASDTLTPLSRC